MHHTKTLVFATNNAHKTKEIGQILGGRYALKTLKEIGCVEDIAETELTLEGNALLKARYVRDKFGLDCFAEDTGLEVAALGGAPGVFTARYAGAHGDAEANMALLLKNLLPYKNRKARFRTVIALILEGQEYLFEGICEGRIAKERSGGGGFGYDPIFTAKGYRRTFAEMSDAEKNAISHRGKATRLFIDFMREKGAI